MRHIACGGAVRRLLEQGSWQRHASCNAQCSRCTGNPAHLGPCTLLLLALRPARRFCGVPPPPELPEDGAAAVSDAACPRARVRAALAALGMDEDRLRGCDGAPQAAERDGQPAPAERLPSIIDYHRAYSSGGAQL